MSRTIKFFGLIALLVVGRQVASGFALLGPLPGYPGVPATFGDKWQAAVIGYDLAYTEFLLPGGPVVLGDIGGPKNLGEEYRRNTPVIYYTYNQNFLDFFGSNGVAAVDSAVGIMDSLTNVDSYSSDLSEFPVQSQHLNTDAYSLGLTDLKSVTLHLLVEQLGLAEPERYTWTLHDRDDPPGCPLTTTYLVVQRNYDIAPTPLNQVQYSPYVNDTLYTYFIVENCTGPAPLAFTVPFSVDPFANSFTAVAANTGFDTVAEDINGNLRFINLGGGLGFGGFYTGLTRDDVAGLRYLLRTNNVNFETPAVGSTVQTTSVGPTIVLTSSNLNTLLLNAQTNPPNLLPVTFPGLIVASSTSSFPLICTTNLIVSIANPNQFGEPYPNNFGTPTFTSVVNCGFQQFFVDTFANVVTNGNLTNNPNITLANTNIFLSFSSNTVVTTLTTSLTPFTAPGQPYPPVVTPQTNLNVTVSTTTINVPSGEYLIFPPGACGFNILQESPPLPPVLTTNSISTATNANGFVDTVTTVTSFTPHQFLVQEILCSNNVGTAATGLYQGIGNVKFIRADFDSLIGQFFQPVTNNYTMMMITNSQLVPHAVQRVATAPDILFSAADLAVGPSGNNFSGTVERDINFDVGNILPGLSGPGVINSPTTFTYNKVGTLFFNGPLAFFNTNAFFFLTEADQFPLLAWGSFDNSTNDPVLYPNGTSIGNLENQILIQITPAPPNLPDGTNGMAYAAFTFTTTGGAFSPPFTWSATGLPAGLALSSTGTLSGTPTQSGTFDFTVQLTDSLGRSVRWSYAVTIH